MFAFLRDKPLIKRGKSHPSLAIVEMFRILIDDEKLEYIEAF